MGREHEPEAIQGQRFTVFVGGVIQIVDSLLTVATLGNYSTNWVLAWLLTQTKKQAKKHEESQ